LFDYTLFNVFIFFRSFNEHDLGHSRSASVSAVDEGETEDSWQQRSETMSGEHKPFINSQKHQTFNF